MAYQTTSLLNSVLFGFFNDFFGHFVVLQLRFFVMRDLVSCFFVRYKLFMHCAVFILRFIIHVLTINSNH